MKNIYLIILVTVLCNFNFSLSAQVLTYDEETGEYVKSKEPYLIEIEDGSCCDNGSEEPSDLSFGSSSFATPNWDRIQQAKEQALSAWFSRQYLNMKNEIGSRFNKTYPSFNEARNDYFKHWEKPNVISDARGIKNKYDSRITTRNGIKEECLRNLKLLELRRLEISIGNIDNTSYGAFTFNGAPIGDIRSLSQLNTLWDQEFSTFGGNEWLLHNDRGVEQFLSLDIINGGMGSSANRFNFDFGILNELLPLQISHYNNIGNGLPWHYTWYQLNLMQLYLNNITLPFSLDPSQNLRVNTRHFSTPSFVESYAISNRRGGRSIFSDGYYMTLPIYQVWLSREGRQEAIYWGKKKERELREAYINNLLEVDLEFTSTETQGIATNSINPVLGADCRSFEYALPPGEFQRGCAVKDFNHTFYAIRPGELSPGYTTSNVSTAYFTMPAGMTNSRAQNLTAIAVTSAIKATDIWYGLNPYATKTAVKQFFRRAIQGAMRAIGGSISTDPPFYIRSPAPYITSTVGPGLGC